MDNSENHEEFTLKKRKRRFYQVTKMKCSLCNVIFPFILDNKSNDIYDICEACKIKRNK